MKNFKEFWDEWGINKEELLMFLTAGMIFVFLFLLSIIL